MKRANNYDEKAAGSVEQGVRKDVHAEAHAVTQTQLGGAFVTIDCCSAPQQRRPQAAAAHGLNWNLLWHPASHAKHAQTSLFVAVRY
jgi:hypothetical protein